MQAAPRVIRSPRFPLLSMHRCSVFRCGHAKLCGQKSLSRHQTVGRNMRSTVSVASLAMLVAAGTAAPQTFHPEIPRAWDDKAVEDFELPLAQPDRSPRHLTADEYYKLKVRPIYRSYPAYAKGREPEGYLESLKQKEPEIIFDPSKLHTKEDWIQAGKLVFESDILFRPAPASQGSAAEVP